MRLVQQNETVYEVHEHNTMVGEVWFYRGSWRAATKQGASLPGEFDTPKQAGLAVMRHLRRSS